MTRAIMVQGTGSDVGKSLTCTGLARAFANRGLAVRPFKPQNMSNNAAVTVDGGEIGRAQALQALAARVPTSVHMNPVLLKPQSPTGSQVILQGKRHATMEAREFMEERTRFLPQILESFGKVSREADLVIVEGAGSAAEVNLRAGDIANMGFAEAAGLNVLLVGDVHRGGVIASIVGTAAIVSEEDRRRLKGVIVNNFHGDPALFDDARKIIEDVTRLPVLGVVPHFANARRLPAEDSLGLLGKAGDTFGAVRVAVLSLPRIANFDDLDPLCLEPNVQVVFVDPGKPVPSDVSLIIIPGSKSTISDLAFLRAQGWDIDIVAHVRRGGRVLGLCGGYQMLGRAIRDPGGVEGPKGTVAGLGLLDVETTLTEEKRLELVDAVHASSQLPLKGYEIHLGETKGRDCARPFARVGGTPEGASSPDGLVAGTYIHGCFVSDGVRSYMLKKLGKEDGASISYTEMVDATLDELASHLARHVDLDRVLDVAAPAK